MATHSIVVIADYLSVEVKGSLSIPEFNQITDEILKQCREQDIHKVLFDVTKTTGVFTDEERVAFATYASATLKDDVDQFAYVYPKEFITYIPQVISQGSGFNATGFTSLDDALRWLKELSF